MSKSRVSKVSFFPNPQEDELLDSVVYRYHRLSGHASLCDTMETLFGIREFKTPRLISGRIDWLMEELSSHTSMDTERLLRRHSLLPALGRHFPEKRIQSAVAESRRSPRIGTSGIYFQGNQTVLSEYFQCCPMCVTEDMQNLGFAYWHRSHQLNGVATCHRHGCDLVSHCPRCNAPIHMPKSTELPSDRCAKCGTTQFAAFSHGEAVFRLANLAHEALSGAIHGTNQVHLLLLVYAMVGRKTSELCRAVEARLGTKFLSALGWNTSEDWLRSGMRSRPKRPMQSIWQLYFFTYAHTLAIVDVLFGSWTRLDQNMDHLNQLDLE